MLLPSFWLCQSLKTCLANMSSEFALVEVMLTETNSVIVGLRFFFFENFVIYFEACDGSICNMCSSQTLLFSF